MLFRKKGKGHAEAEKALHQAEVHVESAKERGEEVAIVAAGLREARHRNHFADQISVLMERRHNA